MEKNVAVLNEPVPQEPANTIRKSNVSIIVSLIALVLAFVPIYFKFFEPITLDFSISRDAYISNTYGGLPDINLSIALRANGPTRKSIIVNSAKITITNLQTKESHELISSFKEGEFPLILQGGDIATRTILFQVNDYIPQQIARYDAWYNKLTEVFPDDKTEVVNEICKQLKEPYLPVNRDKALTKVRTEFEELIEQFQDDFFQKSLAELEKMKDLNSQISDLLHQQPVEQLQKLLFFMSGNYEMQIEILDPFDTSLAVQKRKFLIEDVVTKALQHRFNENLRIPTSQVDPAKPDNPNRLM